VQTVTAYSSQHNFTVLEIFYIPQFCNYNYYMFVSQAMDNVTYDVFNDSDFVA